jgi:hypothetical protein
MMGTDEQSGATGDADLTADTAELISQLERLAGPDPDDVRQVVAEVLAALDRVNRGVRRDRPIDGASHPDVPEAGEGA